jgi:transposase
MRERPLTATTYPARLSEAIDALRRQEVATRPELTHTRRLWLKNWANLSAAQRRDLHHLMRPSAQLATARAHPSTSGAAATARHVPACNRSRTSSPWSRTTGTPIIAWHTEHLSNGLLEGINSLVQATKARARGYRGKTRMITIVYLIAVKLQLPTLTSPTPAYMTSR